MKLRKKLERKKLKHDEKKKNKDKEKSKSSQISQMSAYDDSSKIGASHSDSTSLNLSM